jgi:ABC-type nickel/cobalt efflux system permease component RcnA
MKTGIFLAIRAVGAEYASRLWKSSIYTTIIVSAVSIGVLLWLTSLSTWWWLLAIPVSIGVSVAVGLLAVFRLTIRHVRPKENQTQRELVRAFVNKLETASELIGTPKFIILFRVIRSIAAPRSDSFLGDIVSTKNLKKEFQVISQSFNE